MDFTPISQIVMASVHLPDIHSHSGKELLLIPACATAISASILLLHFLLAFKSVNGLLARVGILEEPTEKIPPPGIGKGTILWFRVARLLGCLGLLVLSIIPFDREPGDEHRNGLVRGILQIAPYVSLHSCLGQFLTPASCTLRFWRCSPSVPIMRAID
jgi:hypothetical protein